ncbi:MAG TPA: hypothetical protein VFM46_13835, partial [Pseudomonadales bacterium]|nr:hypothetical protein [Pseudomonadales bacterium]
MPYDNLPESMWADMDSCVEQVMAEGNDKQAAIAICYDSLMNKSARVKPVLDMPDVAYFGGEVKALPDGKLGGYLVRYSDANTPDLTGDFFSAKTDIKYPAELPVLYQHGQDTKMGRRLLGRATAKADDVGVWIEAQLDIRDEYDKAVLELAKAGKLGWSSG